MPYVVDASAVVALLRNEPGADRVEELLEHADSASLGSAFISTVNLAEVQQVFGLGIPDSLIGETDSVITIADFTAQHAEVAAALYKPTQRVGLSLADRACLALAKTLELPVITADRAWAKTEIGVEVELIR